MSTFLLWVVAASAALAWVCTAILLRAALRDGMVVRERASASLLLATAVTIYLAIGINTELAFPIPLATAIIANRLVFVVLGIIPARWLWLYWRGRFG